MATGTGAPLLIPSVVTTAVLSSSVEATPATSSSNTGTVEAATGKLIWATKLTGFGLAYANHAAWDMASPLLAQGKVYLHSPVGRLYCLDAAHGTLLWQRNLFECQMFRWTEKQGNACGPLAFGETILVSYTGRVGTNYSSPAGTTCTVIASFDAATGQTRWVTKSPYESFRPMNSTDRSSSSAEINCPRFRSPTLSKGQIFMARMPDR